MSDDPQLSLQMQALLNRLQARLGSGLADAAASLLAAAEGAPARLNQEWQLFWEEVEQEAERLAGAPSAAAERPVDEATVAVPTAPRANDPQALIDGLRARVASLSQQLDA